jgi:hypothetical protein
MKRVTLIKLSTGILGLLCGALECFAQIEPNTVPIMRAIGPDRKVWVRSDKRLAATPPIQEAMGDTTPVSDRSIVEIETGMNYRNGNEWTASDATFDLTDDSFVATRMQYKVSLNAELNIAGAVNITTMDNVLLKSTPIAIGLYDAQSGKSVLISSVKDCGGVLVSSNVVVFENAFSGVAADVVYTINKGTFEQDVVITGHLNPGDYGFPTNTTRVQIYTEFFDAPAPERIRRPLRVQEDQAIRAAMVMPDLVDDVLGFGEFTLSTGRASLAGATDSDTGSAPVVKEFTTRGGRTFLIESVEFPSLYPEKSRAAVKPKGDSSKRSVAQLNLPILGQKRAVTPVKDSRARTVAAIMNKKGSIVMDYVGTIGPGLSTPTVFQGDTTYLVTGAVTCSSATTMEGGAIFKYKYISGTSTAYIQLNNTLTTTSSSHRPIIFTAVDDDSVGETMYGLTNSAYAGSINSAGYANPALLFNATSQTINDVRFRYCQEAIRVLNSMNNSVSHAQLVNCIKGIVITGCGSVGSGSGGPLTVKNALFSSVTYPLTFSRASIPATVLQNCTIDTTPRLITDSVSGGGSFINCVFANITALSTGTPTITGNNNGCYLSPSVGTSPITVATNPFEVVKAGSYYLASSSVFRNVGTTNIDSGLAADLKKRTDYSPSVLTGTVSGTLSPTAARDTDVPDLGYHYDPVDYIGRELATTSDGHPLYLTNGVVLAFYGNYGLQVPENGAIISFGTPIQMNRIVWYPSSQEQPVLLDSISTSTNALFDVSGATSSSATKPVLQFRFTDFPMLGLCQKFFKGDAHPLNLKTLSFQDSWLRGVNLVVSSNVVSFGSNAAPTASFINNLLERSTVSLFNGYLTSGGTNYQNPITVTAYNNLFWQGTLVLTYNDLSATTHPTWTFRDNVFDHGTISLSGDGSYTGYITTSFDGFFSTTGSSQLSGTGDVTITNLTYSTLAATGWRWYQNVRSPTLHDVDTGRTGADGGLYHFTTKVSEGKETTSNMDLGFHYVVLNGSNLPVDTDGNGIPDYLDDLDGDGIWDYEDGDPNNTGVGILSITIDIPVNGQTYN